MSGLFFTRTSNVGFDARWENIDCEDLTNASAFRCSVKNAEIPFEQVREAYRRHLLSSKNTTLLLAKYAMKMENFLGQKMSPIPDAVFSNDRSGPCDAWRICACRVR